MKATPHMAITTAAADPPRYRCRISKLQQRHNEKNKKNGNLRRLLLLVGIIIILIVIVTTIQYFLVGPLVSSFLALGQMSKQVATQSQMSKQVATQSHHIQLWAQSSIDSMITNGIWIVKDCPRHKMPPCDSLGLPLRFTCFHLGRCWNRSINYVVFYRSAHK